MHMQFVFVFARVLVTRDIVDSSSPRWTRR